MTTDIVSLAAKYAGQQVVRVGRYSKIKCPFHKNGNEQHPSLRLENKGGKHGGPVWFCDVCHEGGGPVSFLRKLGMSDDEIKQALGEDIKPYTGKPVETCPPPLDPPGAAWQKRAREFVEEARKNFVTFAQSRESITDFMVTDPNSGKKVVKRMYPIDYWFSRGLTVETAEAWGIGYNPKKEEIPGAEFGLPGKVIIPQGFIIPCVAGQNLWYVKIRLPMPLNGDPKDRFRNITGGKAESLYMADEVQKDCTLVFGEGEFDALTLWQEAGDLVTPVTLGSAGNELNIATFGVYLLYPKYKFAAYDLDEAGKNWQGYQATGFFPLQTVDGAKGQGIRQGYKRLFLANGETPRVDYL